MDDKHYSGDELLDRMYGLSARSDGHLDECGECLVRWQLLSQARASSLARQRPEVSETFLSQQRAKTMEKIRRRASRPWLPGPVPALAMASLCAVAIILYRPAMQPIEISDAQFFAEMYSMAEADEPMAAAPIENLFQGEQFQ